MQTESTSVISCPTETTLGDFKHYRVSPSPKKNIDNFFKVYKLFCLNKPKQIKTRSLFLNTGCKMGRLPESIYQSGLLLWLNESTFYILTIMLPDSFGPFELSASCASGSGD